jgi:hypothetical protein
MVPWRGVGSTATLVYKLGENCSKFFGYHDNEVFGLFACLFIFSILLSPTLAESSTHARKGSCCHEVAIVIRSEPESVWFGSTSEPSSQSSGLRAIGVYQQESAVENPFLLDFC